MFIPNSDGKREPKGSKNIVEAGEYKSSNNRAYYAIFPREMGRKIGEAEEIRHASDYDDFYIASREEAERQVVVAGEFIQLVEKYCMSEIGKYY